MTRTEALEAAEALVDRQAGKEPHRSGIGGGNGQPLRDRISEILRVAEFLYVEDRSVFDAPGLKFPPGIRTYNEDES